METEIPSPIPRWTFNVTQSEAPATAAWVVSGHDDLGNTLARTTHPNAEAAIARLMQLTGVPGPVSASSAFVGVALSAQPSRGENSP